MTNRKRSWVLGFVARDVVAAGEERSDLVSVMEPEAECAGIDLL